jgi:DNA processing protein
MITTRERAALLGALLPDPSGALAMALQLLGVEAAWQCFEDRHPSIPEPLWRRWQRLDSRQALDRGYAVGARIVVPGDVDWPSQLDALGRQRPWALWVRGHALPALAQKRSVAIVGARSCTQYGERVAAEFAAHVAAAGYPIVSGGAYGIDAAAHRGALAMAGVTVAVLACGVDLAYPSAHTALFERIVEGGLLVSEAPPGANPTKPAFLIRNRLIAALSYGTVVVEARLRSGSISTYAHARALQRVLMAVPGPVDSAESAGAHALLQTDAQLVTSGADVLGLVAPLDEVTFAAAQGKRTEWDELDPTEKLVHEALPSRGAVTVEALLERVAEPLSVAAMIGSLAALAQRGVISEQCDGSWRRSRKLRGADA